MPFSLFRSHLVSVAVLGAVAGCNTSSPRVASTTAANDTTATPAPAPSGVQFVDVTKSSGLNFRHHSGAFGLVLMPETVGAGVAFIDFDGDGYTDLFFVNGRDWTPAEAEQ